MYGGSLVQYYLSILNVKDSYISEEEPINTLAPENIKSVYWSGSYVTTWYPGDIPQEEFDKIVKLFEEQLHLEGKFNGLTLDDFKSVFSNAHFDDSYSIVGNSTWSTGDFRVKGGAWIKRTNEAAEKHSIYTIVKTSPLSESLVETKSNNYYVDSSLVSFHSPEIDNVRALIDNTDLKFRIIGIAPIKNTVNNVIVESKTTGNSADSGFIKPDNTSYFLNAPMYRDNIWNEDNVLEKQSLGDYYMYLWNKKGSIIGQTANSKKLDSELKPVDIDRTIAELQHKIIALKTISDGCISLPRISQLKYDVTPSVFSSDIIESKYVKGFDSYSICQGNYDNVVVTQDKYKVFWNNSFSTNTDSEVPALQSDPVSIKYTKTPHVLFNLKHEESYEILPYLTLGEKPWNLYSQYNQTGANPTYYSWLEDGKIYKQRSINERCTTPYFYIGELYRDIDYSTLYGGYNENDLEQSNWIPISNPTNIDYSTNDTWGDTYYQKWECLNTYPSTEEDLNSVVDIVSFMVETHINLEGRYDKNRNGLNILNARPDNFNKINPVYSQTNNYFTYNILDEKFNQNKYFNQVAFSLQKTPTSEIDTWCNISLASTFNLDGKYGKLNKLITVNDAIIAFQDKALSVINFNNRTAISTENGVPIEIANSGKVNGYSVISSNVGCQNKLSICEASSGVYFIDDLNKAMYGFNKEGLSNISSKGMSMWFKKNLTGEEKCFYDKLTNDVYITTDNDCLVYNEALDAFTSFMDYSNINSLFNFEGKSFIFDGDSTVNTKLMFAGDYTNNYYIQYKINPEPLIDKTFTNIEFIADKLNNEDIDSIPSKKSLLYPFTEFEVWNEYQYGITNLTKGRTYPNFERKFRIWRADIPRDKSNGRDRIRNPWIYLKLNNTDNNNAKMVFHSFLVKYYK